MLPTLSRLKQRLKAGAPDGLYVFVGDDDLARETAVRAVEEALGGAGEVDRTVLRADEAGVDGTAVAVGSSSLFGGRRLVVVRDFERLKADEQEQLVPLLSRPAPGLVVVLTAAALDGRRKATKELRRAGQLFEFTVPQGEALGRWVAAQARAVGLDMSPGAVAALLDLVPPIPQIIYTELEKLALYTGGEPADEDAVRQVASLSVPFAAERLIFRLTELVVAGKTKEALAALHDLLSVGEVPLVILTMLGRQYRILAAALDGTPVEAKQTLNRVFRVPPFAADQAMRQARALGAAAVEAGLRRILAADEAMKKSQDPRLALEALVVALAQRE